MLNKQSFINKRSAPLALYLFCLKGVYLGIQDEWKFNVKGRRPNYEFNLKQVIWWMEKQFYK